MKKILCVCLGNICRSPLAEGILRKVAQEKGADIEVDSAGTANYHVGDAPDQRSISIGRKYNIDISSHRGQQFEVAHFDLFDIILVMDDHNLNNVRMLARDDEDKNKVKMFRPDDSIVEDPYYGDDSDFENMYQTLMKDALYWITN
jgi:protein-tyrosine phosphatase